MTGKFLTLEGMDGAGKSTHIPLIIQLLEQRGKKVISTREPGGTPLGEKLRDLLLHEQMQVETETLLMFAARAEHIHQVIQPALEQGYYVLSDRFTDASYAYQSGAKKLAPEKINVLESWVHSHLQPDLTLLFDVPVEVSMTRLQASRTLDKFERESTDFFTRIRDTYLSRAKQHPDRFVVINSNLPIHQVESQIKIAIERIK